MTGRPLLAETSNAYSDARAWHQQDYTLASQTTADGTDGYISS